MKILPFLVVIIAIVLACLFPPVIPLLLVFGIIAALIFAMRYPSAAQRIRWVFSMLAAGCLRMAQLCKRGGRKLLIRVSPNKDCIDTTFLAAVAFSRIFYFLISSIVFAALAFEILRYGNFLGVPGEAPAYGNLFVWTGLGAFLMPVIWGFILAEAQGKMPEWMRLFPDGHYKIIDQVVAILMLCATLVVSILIFYSTQCEVSSATNPDPDKAPAQCMSQFFRDSVATGYFTLLFLTVFKGCFWLLMVLGGLAGVLLICFYCVFNLLHFLLVLAAGSILGAPPEGVVTPEIASVHQSIDPEEEIMTDQRKDITIIGFGDVGSRLLPLFAQAAYTLEVQSSFLGSGLVDIDRASAAIGMQVPGLDFRPLSEWMQQVLAEKSGVGAYSRFAYSINEQLVGAYHKKHGGTIIVAAPSSLLPVLCEPLRQLKLRLRTVHLLVVTDNPTDQSCNDLADAGIATYACQSGEDLQEKAIAILGMSTAHQYSCNPVFAKIEQRLLSSASRIGVLSSNIRVQGVLQDGGKQPEVNFADLMTQTTELAWLVMEEVCEENIMPVFLLFVLPFSDALPQFEKFVDSMNSHLVSAHPNATGIFISMPTARGFRCGVHAVYPLVDASPLSGMSNQKIPLSQAGANKKYHP